MIHGRGKGAAAHLATCLAVTAHWFLEQQKTSTELPSSTVSLVSHTVWSASCCVRHTKTVDVWYKLRRAAY